MALRYLHLDRANPWPRQRAWLAVLLAAAVGGAGCVTTYVGPVVEDHTIGLISRPISGPVELAWRIKTLGGEAVERMEIRGRRMPALDRLPIPPLAPARPLMDPALMGTWLEQQSGPCVAGRLTLLINGDAYFPRLEAALKLATNRIDIQTYIFDNDDVAARIADLLKRKSGHVPVRVLMDVLGSRAAWRVQAPSVEDSPQPDISDMMAYLREDSEVEVRRSYNLWLSSDHSKLILVDRHTAFFGGMNIGREYRHDWRDLMVEARGPLADELQRHFNRAWNRAKTFSDLWMLLDSRRRERASPAEPGACYYLVLTTPFTHDIYSAHLRAARLATHHIYVENPYLWNTRFIYALCAARKRGVDVRVTVPLAVNIPIGQSANRVAMNTLLRHGVRVFLYPGMTHVKAAVYDGWASFGTANFDDLSLHKNIEMNLFTADPDFVRDFEQHLLLAGQDRCVEIRQPLPLSLWDELAKEVADFL